MSAVVGENTIATGMPSFTPKYTLMLEISIGFVFLWILAGIIIAWYVRSQTEAEDLKNNFAL